MAPTATASAGPEAKAAGKAKALVRAKAKARLQQLKVANRRQLFRRDALNSLNDLAAELHVTGMR
eukprot:4159211-Karenia_brevis.AAC.1